MFGYNPQQYYGPLNALADITNAYMDKKNMDDAYAAAANFSDDADKQLQPKVAQVIPTTQTGQGLVDAARKQLQPTALNSVADGVQQMAPTMSQLDGAGSSGFLTAAKQFASANPALPQNQGPIHTQSDYDAFAAAKAANPEWYVGDTYVGSDPAAKAAAQAKTQQPAAQGQYDFSNPMQQEYGFQDDKPMQQLSYQEQKAKINQFATSTMKNIVSKYGYETAQKVFPMIQQAMQDKLSGASDAIDYQNRRALMPYLFGDLSTPQAKQKALWAMQEYNNAAKRMGRDGVDTSLMAQMLAANDVSITSKDLGGKVQYYVAPKNGGAFSDGSYIKPIFADAKSVSPDTNASIDEKRYEHDNPSANAQLQAKTSLQVAQMRGSGGNGGNASRITAAKGIITAFNSWVSSHKQALEAGEMKESDYPNYNNYQRAMQMLSQAAGIDSADATGSAGTGGDHSNPTGDNIADWINEAYNRGYTKDQIQASLRQKGYGDSYDSYLWD
ncbi:MAG: hypothetical protein ACRC7I_12715 [Selenomonadaceae bacterium]